MRFYTKNITLNQYVNKERTNRYAAATIKKRLTTSIMVEALQYRNRIDPGGMYDLKVYWITPDNRTDADNVFFMKPILDGLTKAGIIRDDNRKHIRNISHYIRTVKNKAVIIIRFKKINK